MNLYTEKLYLEVKKNQFDLEALQELKEVATAHWEYVEQLIDLINYKIDLLLDYEKQFNQTSVGNKDRGITVIWPDWPIMSFKTIKEAAQHCKVNPKSVSNVLQKKQETAWGVFSFVYADEL